MLEDSVSNRNSQFRIPTFICGYGSEINGRIVVLRKADKENNLVQFHSDIRSDKIDMLKKNSSAAILFYDKEEKIQVRLKVECTIIMKMISLKNLGKKLNISAGSVIW
jgi:3-hydroxyisobutyrate dehydrogenase